MASGAAIGARAKATAAATRPNGFAGHLGWHEAPFAPKGLTPDGARVRRLPRRGPDEVTLQRVDCRGAVAPALLGADAGDAGTRRRRLAAGGSERRPLVFGPTRTR